MRRRLAALWPFSIESGVIRAYTGALGRHGATPQGVFWNSATSQNARFAALLAMIRVHQSETGTGKGPPLIADIGCGYGALYGYMQERSDFADWGYVGLDINPAMIRACRHRHPADPSRFQHGPTPRQPVDYALFSGTFNLCMIDDAARWRRYILDQLSACRPHCRKGIVMNLLCCRQIAITNNIFYAGRQEIVAELRHRFGDVRIADTSGVKHDTTFLIPA